MPQETISRPVKTNDLMSFSITPEMMNPDDAAVFLNSVGDKIKEKLEANGFKETKVELKFDSYSDRNGFMNEEELYTRPIDDMADIHVNAEITITANEEAVCENGEVKGRTAEETESIIKDTLKNAIKESELFSSEAYDGMIHVDDWKKILSDKVQAEHDDR